MDEKAAEMDEMAQVGGTDQVDGPPPYTILKRHRSYETAIHQSTDLPEIKDVEIK